MRGLRLDPERMRANLDLGGGLIMAEAVMLDLGTTIGRQHAHDVVYDAAQAAFVKSKPVCRAARRRPARHEASRALGDRSRCSIPTAYTGLCADDGSRRRRPGEGGRA